MAKTTIYRRWPSKDELVVAAVAAFYHDVTVGDSGDARADLVALVEGAVRVLTTTRAGQVMPHLAGQIAGGTPLGRTYMQAVLQPRMDAVRGLLATAVAGGELRPDLDLDLATAGIVGPVIFLVLTGQLAERGDGVAERIVDQAIAGLGA